MAVNLSNASATLSTTAVKVFTAAKQTIATGITVANKAATAGYCTVYIKRGVSITDIGRNVALPSGSSAIFAGGNAPKVNLAIGDEVWSSVSTSGVSADCMISYVEIG